MTGQDYKQEYLGFIRNEKRRCNIMTMARIQPCFKKLGIDLSYYNGDIVFPGTVTNRDNALYLYNNHFCLIWKSEGVSFKDAFNELKDNFNIVENFITEENGTCHFKYQFIPKKIDSHLSNFIVYDLETYSTDRARPYNIRFYRLSKIAGRFDRDPTQEELQKYINDTLPFMGDNCIGNALEFY